MAWNLTLALIKPHIVFDRKVGKIITLIEEEGFAIVGNKMLQLRDTGVSEFYEEHVDKPFFGRLKKSMTSGPLYCLILAKTNAVEEWRKVIGDTDPNEAEPGTIRALYGDKLSISNNAVHGSATDADARKEIVFFFGRELKLLDRLEEANKERVV